MNTESVGKSREDYLEAILVITDKKGCCRNVDIANHLLFKKPSVTVAMKRLLEEGYISINSDNFISLTEEGKTIAEKIYARHRFFKNLFISFGVDNTIAEHDACLIEHCISEESYEKLVTWYQNRQ